MGKSTIFDRIMDFIAHIGWKLYLFGSQQTENQYRQAIYKDVVDEEKEKIINLLQKESDRFWKSSKTEEMEKMVKTLFEYIIEEIRNADH